MQNKLKNIRVRNNWKHIVIHHSGTFVGSAKAFERAHRARGMENGMAYHFLIGNGRGMKDGEVVIGRRWKEQLAGGHLASEALNQVSIGICLIGNFEVTQPTSAQMRSLQALVQNLLQLTDLPSSAVTTHGKIHPRHTECPGSRFPFKLLSTGIDSGAQ